ncbi:MAG: cyclic nucleotide-binding domain-containing protein [Candidatus Promineifilaceae bacterium]
MSYLSTLDLLNANPVEQDILRCVTRFPRLSVRAITERINLPSAEVAITIEELVTRAKLVEQLVNNERVFVTRFQLRAANVRNLPAPIQALLAQPDDEFLSNTDIGQTLSKVTLEKMQQICRVRKLQTNEVLAWQGKSFPFIGVVRSGLLGKVQISGNRAQTLNGYLRQGEWLGVAELFGNQQPQETYKAVTACTVMLWPIEAFVAMQSVQHDLATAVARYLSKQLRNCLCHGGRRAGHVWAVDGLAAGDGASLIAAQLALCALDSAENSPSVVIWDWKTEVNPYRDLLSATIVTETPSGFGIIQQLSNGIMLFHAHQSVDYPPAVYADILLTELKARFDYILIDLGHHPDPLQREVIASASVVISITTCAASAQTCRDKWQAIPTPPQQKRLVLLNKTNPEDAQQAAQFTFQCVLPFSADFPTNRTASTLSHTIAELFRRLSLNHTIAIFVPSTITVDQQTNNETQVNDTLSFLGSVFGGATSSRADGIWKSDQGGLVTEVVTIVRTFVSKRALDSNLEDVLHFATALKRDMQQEAVAIDVDNKLILV